MEEPIKVKDLVMVVRGHSCVVAAAGGIPFTVRALLPQIAGGWFCPICRTRNLAPNETIGASGLGPVDDSAIPVNWLKRIPPLSELEGEKRDERIEA